MKIVSPTILPTLWKLRGDCHLSTSLISFRLVNEEDSISNEVFALMFWKPTTSNGNSLYFVGGLLDYTDKQLEGKYPTPCTRYYIFTVSGSFVNSIYVYDEIWSFSHCYSHFPPSTAKTLVLSNKSPAAFLTFLLPTDFNQYYVHEHMCDVKWCF